MAKKGIFIAENMASTTVGSLLRSGQSATELENGAVVTLGDLVVGENELYEIGAVAAITDDVYLVDGVELQADEQLTKGLHDFVNPANKPVRLRKASRGDRFSISEASITGTVKVGEVVVFAKYSGTEVKVDEKEYLILSERDILAVLD